MTIIGEKKNNFGSKTGRLFSIYEENVNFADLSQTNKG